MAELVQVPGFKGRFALGLSWRHAGRLPNAARMRELGMGRGEWGVAYESEGRHAVAGFCPPIAGVRRASTVRPLAAIAAYAHPQPWLGIYALEDGRYWLLAVRDWQQPVDGGDVVGSRAEIEEVRRRLYDLGGYTEYDGTLADFGTTLKRKHRAPALTDFRPRGPWPLIVAAGTVVTVSAVGGFLWYEHQREEDLALQRQASAQRAQAIAQRKQAEWKQLTPPWADRPLADDVLTICAAQWQTANLAASGWAMDGWNCQIDGLNAQSSTAYTRRGGLAADAPGSLNRDGQQSALSRGAATTFARFQLQVDDAQTATRALWTLAQRVGATLALDPPLPAAQATDKDLPPPPAWQVMPFKMTFAVAPWIAPDPADWFGVHGVRISRIHFSPADGWITEGTLNAAPPSGMPPNAHMPDGYPAPIDAPRAFTATLPLASMDAPVSTPVLAPRPRLSAPAGTASTPQPMGPVPVVPPHRTSAHADVPGSATAGASKPNLASLLGNNS
ncbi:type 4b pilus protein PilO2 (plasmid) [Burkholderia cenocepacia]|uniref:type 4b pilus protein PilO2 n=1 Tax=Burkholderia cenocepacia TaxID=95486 RepID=UPI0020A1680D|nr:type 4b pilus protein PilO2 [Burkholderia cenocepacia]MCO8402821.1 type 4b pilus protein PilO2 [Burkholderia cenocepacia]MCO8415060.1 type 4b pilus protein PilO2 [Burkholderia cenocepacia]MCO8423044.1 type 4b pilus protein PilO2 [Burkholderia cenocepacia]MCO8474807.1 type 4b pilus protein PilO2 [Burkholderia cenocepacia]MCO8482013.1 type 4b pilus protein PilO2 [Burkholderia cenocepacia]